MADETTNQQPQTWKGAIVTMNPKIVLAFFLVVLAFILIVLWMKFPPQGDGNLIALLAGFVTLFITMAKSAVDYQFSSSAGSDKKDDQNAKVADKLAEKVQAPAAPPPAPLPPAVVVAWWSALSQSEQDAISAAAATDPKVKAFIDAAKSGRATPDDLAYLMSLVPPLLTQEKVDALKAM